jgi:hypothetical protein
MESPIDQAELAESKSDIPFSLKHHMKSQELDFCVSNNSNDSITEGAQTPILGLKPTIKLDFPDSITVRSYEDLKKETKKNRNSHKIGKNPYNPKKPIRHNLSKSNEFVKEKKTHKRIIHETLTTTIDKDGREKRESKKEITEVTVIERPFESTRKEDQVEDKLDFDELFLRKSECGSALTKIEEDSMESINFSEEYPTPRMKEQDNSDNEVQLENELVGLDEQSPELMVLNKIEECDEEEEDNSNLAEEEKTPQVKRAKRETRSSRWAMAIGGFSNSKEEANREKKEDKELKQGGVVEGIVIKEVPVVFIENTPIEVKQEKKELEVLEEESSENDQEQNKEQIGLVLEPEKENTKSRRMFKTPKIKKFKNLRNSIGKKLGESQTKMTSISERLESIKRTTKKIKNQVNKCIIKNLSNHKSSLSLTPLNLEKYKSPEKQNINSYTSREHRVTDQSGERPISEKKGHSNRYISSMDLNLSKKKKNHPEPSLDLSKPQPSEQTVSYSILQNPINQRLELLAKEKSVDFQKRRSQETIETVEQRDQGEYYPFRTYVSRKEKLRKFDGSSKDLRKNEKFTKTDYKRRKESPQFLRPDGLRARVKSGKVRNQINSNKKMNHVAIAENTKLVRKLLQREIDEKR